jgi:CheY-like chemotaxis protein
MYGIGHWAYGVSMRILVVDDKFESRWMITGWLTAFLNKATVESAASADEALSSIERRRPDVVLASHPLPEVDGIELARRIKALRDAPTVVVMTQKSDSQFEADCAAAGADYCLEKHQLQARLLDFLKERFQLGTARRSFI